MQSKDSGPCVLCVHLVCVSSEWYTLHTTSRGAITGLYILHVLVHTHCSPENSWRNPLLWICLISKVRPDDTSPAAYTCLLSVTIEDQCTMLMWEVGLGHSKLHTVLHSSFMNMSCELSHFFSLSFTVSGLPLLLSLPFPFSSPLLLLPFPLLLLPLLPLPGCSRTHSDPSWTAGCGRCAGLLHTSTLLLQSNTAVLQEGKNSRNLVLASPSRPVCAWCDNDGDGSNGIMYKCMDSCDVV